MKKKDLTIAEFVIQTGSSAPTPGGGSIASLTAATGAALIEMVANLTIGKEGFAAVEPEMKEIQLLAKSYEIRFLDLIEEDCACFGAFMEALQLPKTTEEEKQIRTKSLQQAYKQAAEVPLKIGLLANEMFDLAELVIKKGNPNLITDGAIAVMNIRCAVKAAFLNVKINLVGIKDESYVKKLREKIEVIESKLDNREQELLNLIKL